jgi:hypothetical protein
VALSKRPTRAIPDLLKNSLLIAPLAAFQAKVAAFDATLRSLKPTFLERRNLT